MHEEARKIKQQMREICREMYDHKVNHIPGADYYAFVQQKTVELGAAQERLSRYIGTTAAIAWMAQVYGREGDHARD